MKIGFIGTKGMNFGEDAFGGFETVVTELGPRLVVAGHEVTIYCRKKLYSTKVFPHAIKGVKLKFLTSIETKNLGTMSNSLLSIFSAIKSGTEIIFLFNISLGIFIPLFKLFNIKVVTNLDGVEWKRGKWGTLAKLIFRIGAFLNVKLADILISDCHEIKKIYVQKFKRDSLVIPYGAGIRNDLDVKRIQQFGLKPNNYFLLATRFIPDNNPLFIIKSYLKSNTERPLVVLGKNYYKSKYEMEIKKCKDPRVLFIGHVSDRKLLYEFYKYSYCYIHGHSVGGTNPSLLEALANSCCVLALNTPFNKEVLHGGKFGLYFELRMDALVEKINFLDRNPVIVKSFKGKAIERIKAYYNWGSITEKYLEFLELLGNVQKQS